MLPKPLLLLATCGLALALTPSSPAAPLPPAHGAAPLLYVRFALPAGAHVTLFQGTPAGSEFDLPITVGARPGYIYRVKLSHFSRHPELALFPTLEIRGTLHLPAGLRAEEHPVPIVLTEEDITLAMAGGLVTKVYFLENPERAQPVTTRPDQPVEITLRPEQDPADAARAFGRPMLILRLGARSFGTEELVQESIPGTLLLPGAAALAPPARPPCLPATSAALFDPILGPRHPDEECMHDGGDIGAPVGLDTAGRLHGLDPSDTVAEYTDNRGQKHLAISNRVCLCVPRFVIMTMPLAPASHELRVGPVQAENLQQQLLLRGREKGIELRQNLMLAALNTRERASGMIAETGPVPIAQIQGQATVFAVLHEQTIVGTLVKKIPEAPARPLVLCKTVDKQSVHIGEIVTFTLTYTNTGGQPITGVVVSDSLTGRLEYVPGSAKSDRASVFTLRDNEAGSAILRWEIAGQLLGGESGVVSFQARVR